METIEMTIKGQSITIVIAPVESCWDAVQTKGTMLPNGYGERGRGDFDIDGLRIMAEDLRTAKMIARKVKSL